MKCPYCGHMGDKVVDSRESKEGDVIRRRRECLECSRRFTSYERIDEIPYMVVKKDGSRERFERQKLIGGMLKACEKRPVSVSALEAVADRIESQIRAQRELLAAVSHELRTPLNAIIGYSEMLVETAQSSIRMLRTSRPGIATASS